MKKKEMHPIASALLEELESAAKRAGVKCHDVRYLIVVGDAKNGVVQACGNVSREEGAGIIEYILRTSPLVVS